MFRLRIDGIHEPPVNVGLELGRIIQHLTADGNPSRDSFDGPRHFRKRDSELILDVGFVILRAGPAAGLGVFSEILQQIGGRGGHGQQGHNVESPLPRLVDDFVFPLAPHGRTVGRKVTTHRALNRVGLDLEVSDFE